MSVIIFFLQLDSLVMISLTSLQLLLVIMINQGLEGCPTIATPPGVPPSREAVTLMGGVRAGLSLIDTLSVNLFHGFFLSCIFHHAFLIKEKKLYLSSS